MNTFRTLPLLLPLLVTALPAHADGGTLEFEGQIVQSSCQLSAAPAAEPSAINLQAAPENDACSAGFPAYIAQYLPLNSDESGRNNQVITITYN